MSWVSAVPDVLACVGLFFAPGLLATYLGGLRGITAWATAPLVTVAVVAAVAVLGGLFDFRFGVWPVVAGTGVMACLSAGLSLLLRTRGVEPQPRDPRGYSLAVVAGAVAAAVIGGVTFVTGVKGPDVISESYDAVFHYSAVRYIEQTGKASPLTIGTVGQPGVNGAFYPDAWHAMVALLAELTGAAVPVAVTLTCLVVAVLVWPLSCLLLARHLFGAVGGRAAAAAVITGMLASLFGAFPWILTGAWGVLWPNVLGMALAPAGVALGMSLTRTSDGDTFGAQRWFFGLAAAWAIGIAHPNSALSVAVICVFPLLMAIGPYLAGQYRRHRLGTTLVLLAIVAVTVVGALVASKLTLVRGVDGMIWPTFDTPAHAAVSALSNSTNGLAPELLLATFLIIGAVACFVWRQWRWLVCAELVIVALYVGSAAVGTPLARVFTGLWYDDSHRIAATLPVVAIPLTTIGVLAAGEWLQRVLPRVASAGAVAARPALAIPLAVGAVVAAATAVQSVPRNASIVGLQFNDDKLVGPAKLQFFQSVVRLVPASALVADNPFEGTSFLFALSGTHVLFPQLNPSSNNAEMSYLASNLVQLSRNPRACDLVRRYGVGYMVIAPDYFFQGSGNPGFYKGVANPARKSGFRLMAADGPLRLYKITICQPASHPAGPVEAASRVSATG
ncbi:MAG: DUF6541 family protein [Streptosporangiaceae bacterium]